MPAVAIAAIRMHTQTTTSVGMGTATTMPTKVHYASGANTNGVEPTDAAGRSTSLMQLLWLASPALPVGGFAYSECLERAVNCGLVTSGQDASDWLVDQLLLSLARGDLVVVAQAWEAWQHHDSDRLQALNAWVLQTRESSELRAQTVQMGRSLCQWLHHHTTATSAELAMLAQLAPTYPLAFALAAHCTGAALPDGLTAYAFSWAENMVQAAVKSMPLGQSAGQRVLSAVAEHIPQAVEVALHATDATRQVFCPMLAILSSQHETQYSRLFRS